MKKTPLESKWITYEMMKKNLGLDWISDYEAKIRVITTILGSLTEGHDNLNFL